MSALIEFFAMGGYAFYVWSSFGAAAVLIGGVAIWGRADLHRARRETLARARHAGRDARAGRTS